MLPKITYADRRGEGIFRYGFLYFEDNSWMGYVSHESGVGVRLYDGDRGGNSFNHLRAAARFLNRR